MGGGRQGRCAFVDIGISSGITDAEASRDLSGELSIEGRYGEYVM